MQCAIYERKIKKQDERDEKIQKYLDETIYLIKDMSDNEVRNRVSEKVDKIFTNLI